MKIDSKLFTAALDKIQPATKVTKTSQPILSYVHLEIKEGTLKASTTNLVAYCEALVPCEGTDPFPALCVPFLPLYRFVSRPDFTGAIELTTDSTKLTLKVGRARLDFPYLPGVEFPAPPYTIDTKSIGLHTFDLAEGIESVAWATGAKAEVAWPLNEAIYVKVSANSMLVAGTDRAVAGWFRRDSIAAETSFMFHSDYANAMSAALQAEAAQLYVTENWVVITHRLGLFAVRKFEGEYYDVGRLTGHETQSLGSIDKIELLNALVTITCICSDSFLPVNLQFNGSTLTVLYAGQYEEELNMVGKIDTRVSVSVDARLLKKLLNHWHGDKLPLFKTKSGNALLVQDGDFTSMSALLQSKQYEKKEDDAN